jgi:hypothetical protein
MTQVIQDTAGHSPLSNHIDCHFVNLFTLSKQFYSVFEVEWYCVAMKKLTCGLDFPDWLLNITNS